MSELRDWDVARLSRDDIAELVSRHAPLVRARVRRRLNGGARRLFDSLDVMSTLMRRVDKLACEGNLRARSEGELIALLVRIADNAVIDRRRVADRLREAEAADSGWARAMASRVDEPEDADVGLDVIARAFAVVECAEDRSVLGLWLQGLTFDRIGQVLAIPPATVRWRWSKIRALLSEEIGAGS